MHLEAIVHPLSISQRDPNFDANLHIPVEILNDPLFQKKMQFLPVTARHHDTMRAVEILMAKKTPLNARNMKTALDNLHHTLPKPMDLARQVLEKSKLPVNPENLWRALPRVTPHARGPGVFGQVEKFFYRPGFGWMVEVFVDPKKLDPFQKKLIKQNGALGQVSLTHAVLDDGTYEPLELSFTIEGLRNGSAINRIIAASKKSVSFYKQHSVPIAKKMDITPAPEQPDEIRLFYDQLGELDQSKKMQSDFVRHMKTVTASKATVTAAQEQRLDDLEKAFALVQEATANALNELGPSCFGNLRPRTAEESSNVMHTAATLQLVLAAAANNVNKRKRETDELDEALKEVTSSHKVVAASKAKNVMAPEDDFFRELRTMRQALKALP
jgi:hypothetical protein